MHDVIKHLQQENNRCGAMDNMPLCCELIAKKDILNLLEIEEVDE